MKVVTPDLFRYMWEMFGETPCKCLVAWRVHVSNGRL